MKRRIAFIQRVLKDPSRSTPFADLWNWARKPKRRKVRHLRWKALFTVSKRKQTWHREQGDRARRAGNGRKAKRHYSQARKWGERKKVYRRRMVATKPPPAPKPIAVVGSAGDPHWGGCRAVTDEIIRHVAGRAGTTSRKRTATFGNPGSDHHTSQVTADAVDFAIGNAFWLRDDVMRKLGVSGTIRDYGFYYITRGGLRFRIQPIASTHGTGPHLHMGVRRA